MIQEHTTEIRVRYNETDAMGLLHHSRYLVYFEIARTELYRAQGGSYREMEESGLFFVVARVKVDYKTPARYDDVLRVKAIVTRITPAKLVHLYEIHRGDQLIAKGETLLACVDAQGTIQRIPAAIEKTIQRVSESQREAD